MDKFDLYCDFLEAKLKANQLENQANQIRRMANNSFQNDLNRLKRCWDGEACKQYLAKGNKLIENANSIADSLMNSAQTIRVVAERVYNAELRALELAKTRTHK